MNINMTQAIRAIHHKQILNALTTYLIIIIIIYLFNTQMSIMSNKLNKRTMINTTRNTMAADL